MSNGIYETYTDETNGTIMHKRKSFSTYVEGFKSDIKNGLDRAGVLFYMSSDWVAHGKRQFITITVTANPKHVSISFLSEWVKAKLIVDPVCSVNVVGESVVIVFKEDEYYA